MNKLIFILLLGFMAMVSCKTPQSFTNTVVETKWRDTTIYVKIPVYVDKIIEVPIPNYKDSLKIKDLLKLTDSLSNVIRVKDIPIKSLTKRQGLIGMNLYGRWIAIEATAFLTDSTILYNYKDTLTAADSIKIYNAIKETTTDNTITLPPEKYVPKIYKYALRFVILQFILLVAYIVIKLKLGSVSALKELLKNKIKRTG